MPGTRPGMTRRRWNNRNRPYARHLRLADSRLAERGLRGRKPCDRHAIGRAGYVIQPDLMTEGDGSGIAAMLAANANLQIRTSLAPSCNADLHQFTNAIAVHRDKGIDLQDTLGNIGTEETRCI